MKAAEAQPQPAMCVAGRAARRPGSGQMLKPALEPIMLIIYAYLSLLFALRMHTTYACMNSLEEKPSTATRGRWQESVEHSTRPV